MKYFSIIVTLMLSGCACQHQRYTSSGNPVAIWAKNSQSLNVWGQFKPQIQVLDDNHRLEREVFWCDSCNQTCASSERITNQITIRLPAKEETRAFPLPDLSDEAEDLTPKKLREGKRTTLSDDSPNKQQRVDEKSGLKSNRWPEEKDRVTHESFFQGGSPPPGPRPK